MYERTTTASRRAEQQARERLVHCSVAFMPVENIDPTTGVKSVKWVRDPVASKGTYRKN